jgi:Rps23 Pro-64 3,4-dihydroxylase Tpa1-like proline 4-hydroxylase
MNKEIYEKLITTGFYEEVLSIEDINFLKKIAHIAKTFDYKNAAHTNFKDDYSRNVPFEELEKLKEECAPLKLWQFWYSTECIDKDFNLSNEEYLQINKIFERILKKCYPEDMLPNEDRRIYINCTMYNKMCYINPHYDGWGGNKLCNILIYLNEDYKDGYGGELILNNETKIIPNLGRIVVIDFSFANPNHEVAEVLDDSFKRCALMQSFLQKKVL